MKQSDRKMNKKISPFVTKLINILEDSRNKNCVGWVSQNSFVIVDSDDLSQNVLSRYFKHSNFSSFIRQLNIYGFQKIKTEQNHHYYQHKNFIKSNRKQLRLIQRKLRKTQNVDNASEMQTEKNKVVKDQPQVSELIRQLKQENDKIKIQNNSLREQLLKIKKENKKQIQSMISFLSSQVSNFKNNLEEKSVNQQKMVSYFESTLKLLKQQLQSVEKNQHYVGRNSFENIFRLMGNILQQNTKMDSIESKSSQTKSLELRQLQIQNLPNFCRPEQNKVEFKQNEELGFEEPNYGLNIDNFF